MAALRTGALVLISCLVLGTQVRGQNVSDVVWDVMSLISGSWDNSAQVNAGSTEHDSLAVRYIPVHLPAVSQKPLIFLEDANKGNVTTMNLVEVTQDDKDNNIIHLIPYNFTDPSKYKPGEFNVEELQNLTSESLWRRDVCNHSYVRLQDGVYSGLFSICRVLQNGRHPMYAVTSTCDDGTAVFPFFAFVRATSIPYRFKLSSPRPPLINAPEGYVSPCDKSRPGST
ncbi:hypothetical protein BsWGS_23107 [Bradybaena similaris]